MPCCGRTHRACTRSGDHQPLSSLARRQNSPSPFYSSYTSSSPYWLTLPDDFVSAFAFELLDTSHICFGSLLGRIECVERRHLGCSLHGEGQRSAAFDSLDSEHTPATLLTHEDRGVCVVIVSHLVVPLETKRGAFLLPSCGYLF